MALLGRQAAEIELRAVVARDATLQPLHVRHHLRQAHGQKMGEPRRAGALTDHPARIPPSDIPST
eukprot:scaffold14336_cov115-Isochrysis_galbana.AAC.2